MKNKICFILLILCCFTYILQAQEKSVNDYPKQKKRQSMNNNHYNKNLQPFANKLRHKMTKAEACLWKYALRASGLGVPFRRERPIGRFIADFVCLPLKLIIEVDGVTHLYKETQVTNNFHF